jgi:hypothetical protein
MFASRHDLSRRIYSHPAPEQYLRKRREAFSREHFYVESGMMEPTPTMGKKPSYSSAELK